MRLIDADALIKYMNEEVPLKYFMGRDIGKADNNLMHIKNEIRMQPTIDAVPVKHGHWILKYRDNGDCSICGENVDFPLMCCYGSPSTRYEPYSYCPWCGAKMDEVTE